MAKLVRPEAETEHLRHWLGSKRWVLSDLHRTELRRAAGRAGGRALARAERLRAESDVIRIDAEVFDRAGRLEPLHLRSLDALHLAAATTLGEDLAGMVVYDDSPAVGGGRRRDRGSFTVSSGRVNATCPRKRHV